MQRKLMFLFTTLILFSLMIAPVSIAKAQVATQASAPDCPPFDPALMRDKGFLQSLPPECSKAYQKLMQNGGSQAIRPDITPLALGGPDAFGYTYDDSVPYSWVDASILGTDSGVVGDDVSSGPITIGFNFPFYGLTQTQLYFSTNGLITFGAGSLENINANIPSMSTPNNLIAPFWEDLFVGSPYNSGAIFYSQGGTASNHYFVIEWRNVTTWAGSSAFSFEAILYENGDIVVQHQSLPASYSSTVGIENSLGNEGLPYQFGSSGLSAPKAIHFYYPLTLTARVLVSPLKASSFAALGENTDFTITVANTGSMGTDTYYLMAASAWPVTFYAADGVTPLADTGSVAQGSTVNIVVKVQTPGAASVGDTNTATITARSFRDISKSKTATLQTAVPAPFAQIYEDYADGAMSFDLIQPNAQVVKKATSDWHFGNDMAVTAAPNGNFVYLWTKYRSLGSVYVNEIEYVLLDHYGNTVRAVSKLMDNSGAVMNTYDSSPAIAVAPNGIIGVAWYRYLYNTSSSHFNYNIYFATLDGSGNLLSGPTNVTNNVVWGTNSDPDILQFSSPTIAASDDNRFTLSWEDDRKVGASWQHDIWYAVRDTAGAGIFAPAALTGNNGSYTPFLNSLTGGKTILTWDSNVPNYGTPTYAVLNSSGGISKAATTLGVSGVLITPDAVLLSNHKVAIAWATNTGVQFAILNPSYALESGPTSANSPSLAQGYALSVTTDSSSRVIMTWADGTTLQNLFYALGDSTGAFTTNPMSYKQTYTGSYTSYNGQGNALYGPGYIFLPLIMR